MGNRFVRTAEMLLSALIVAAGMTLAAQETPPTETATPHTGHHMKSEHHAKMSDDAFAKAAAEGGLAEVKLGQLAQDKGHSDAVKDFGKRMVTDHQKANTQLKDAASQANLTLPEQPSPKDKAEYDRLAKLSGPAFDHAYARLMVRDHEHDVAAFRREAKYGTNDAIKHFASQTLPVLEEHLTLARKMNREVHPSSTSMHHRSPTGAKAGASSK